MLMTREELTSGGDAGVSRWARRIAGKDALWKALYLERWDDPSSHAREREALKLGWKTIYEQKDTAVRRSDEEEEATRQEVLVPTLQVT